MINLKDCQIARVYRGKFNNLSVTINIKQEDFSPEIEETLRSLWITGDAINFSVDKNSAQEQQKVIKKQSIYQWFKRQCERLGVDYIKEKEALGVEHLRDLEDTNDQQTIYLLLRSRITDIETSLGFYSQEI